jgi:hypothetical protein
MLSHKITHIPSTAIASTAIGNNNAAHLGAPPVLPIPVPLQKKLRTSSKENVTPHAAPTAAQPSTPSMHAARLDRKPQRRPTDPVPQPAQHRAPYIPRRQCRERPRAGVRRPPSQLAQEVQGRGEP